mgnify:CR=1 FL=1
MDVTSIIQKFSASFYQSADYPTGIPNNGFIIKKPREIEEDGFGFGQLQYFILGKFLIKKILTLKTVLF